MNKIPNQKNTKMEFYVWIYTNRANTIYLVRDLTKYIIYKHQLFLHFLVSAGIHFFKLWLRTASDTKCNVFLLLLLKILPK